MMNLMNFIGCKSSPENRHHRLRIVITTARQVNEKPAKEAKCNHSLFARLESRATDKIRWAPFRTHLAAHCLPFKCLSNIFKHTSPLETIVGTSKRENKLYHGNRSELPQSRISCSCTVRLGNGKRQLSGRLICHEGQQHKGLQMPT